jgi:hypothetical protein
LCSYDINFNPVACTALRIVDIVVIGTQQSNVNFREIEIWQGSLSNNDIGVASIDSINNICSTSSIPIYATVTNYGKNAITSFNLYWSINGSLQSSIPWTGTLDTIGGSGASSTQILLGSHSFSNTPTTIKAWTGQPNNIVDTTRANDTSTLVRSISMFGTFTVGGVSPDFANLNAAVQALQARGMCGPVTLEIRPGTYTEQVLFQNIPGISAVNTLTIDGINKSNRTYEFASTNTNARYTIGFNNMSHVILKNLTIRGYGHSASNFAYPVHFIGNTNNVIIDNCNILVSGDYAQTTLSTNFIPLVFSGSPSSYSAAQKMDSITVSNCTTQFGYFAVTLYCNTSAPFSTNINFINNTFANWQYYGLYLYYPSYGRVIGNTITAGSVFNPIYNMYWAQGSGNTPVRPSEISNNTIVGIGSGGMYLTGVNNPTTVKGLISNNVIHTQITGTGYGIAMFTCSRWMLRHNSINMNSSGSTANTNAGLYISAGANNSIVNNNLARTASGLGMPLYVTATSAVDTVNYNNYFKVDTAGLIYVGTSFNPSTFRGAGGRDVNSYNENPTFVAPNNLRVLNGCLVGTATPNTPTDILNVTRSTTNPTLGAYEYFRKGNDLSVEAILQPTAPISLGLSDLMVRIRNNGLNSVTSFDLSYTNNNGTPENMFISLPIGACDTASYLFTGSQQINLGNVNVIKVYTSNPNAGIDSIPGNDTLTTSLYTPLNGTFTIGGSGANFPSISAAANTLSIAGVSGPVEFIINPGTYNERVTINSNITNLSASTPIVFNGVNRSLVNITNNAASQPVFFVNEARYITLKNVTITNTSPSGVGFGVKGNNTSNAGTGCGIVNCQIDMPNYTTGTAYPIIFTGSGSAYGVSAMRADSITIDSNIVNKGYYAITVYGASNALYNRSIFIRRNTCNNIYYMGAYVAYNYNPIVMTNNYFDMNITYGYYGIYHYSNQSASTTEPHIFNNNSVINHGGYGVYLYYPTTASATPLPILFANNIIVSGPTYNSIYGVYMAANTNGRSEFYHNTVVNRYPATSTTYTTFYYTGSTTTIVKNNIFVNLAGVGNCAYFATNPTGNAVNYNMYFNSSNTNVVYRNGVFTNPSTYKTVTAGGDSSFYEMPLFVSPTNLRVTNGCTPRGVDLTSIVPADIDGNTRSTSPMVGAFEIGSFSNDIELTQIVSPKVPLDTGVQDFKVLVKNVGNTSILSFNVSYQHNSGPVKTIAYTGSGLAPCGFDTIVFSGSDQINIINGLNTIKTYTSAPNAGTDGNPLNDTVNTTLGTPLVGTYVIGSAPSDYFDIGDAMNDAKNRGIKGNVVFAIKSGVYNQSYVLDNVPGTGPGQTITITSLAGHRDSVILQYFTNTGLPTQVVDITGSYINLKKLTIRQLNGNLTSYVVRFSGNVSTDTIEDCHIWGPIFGIDGSSTGTYSIYASGITSNGVVFRNNYIKGSFYGVYWYGASNYSIRNTIVENNLFDSTAYGAWYYMYYTVGTKFRNNVMNHRIVSPSYTTGYEYFYYNDSGYTYTNNQTNFFGAKGLYRYNYYTRNATTNRALVANNTANATGLFYWYFGNSVTNNIDIVHNTLSMGSGYFYLANSGLTGVRVLNNIFRSPSNTYAYYITTAPTGYATLISDHNLVSSSSTTPYYAGANRTLLQMRTNVPAYERYSIVMRPPFTSATNITPNVNDTTIWAINGKGTQLGSALFPQDVNNVTRPTTLLQGAPDIGAHEVTPAANVLPPMAVASPAIPVAGGTQHFLVGEDSVASFVWDAFATPPASIVVRQYTGEAPNLQGSTGAAGRQYITMQTTGSGSYLYDLNLHYRPTLLNNISSETETRSAFAATTTWTSNTLALSTPDSLRKVVFTPSMSLQNGTYTITDNTNQIVSFLTIDLHPQSQSKCNGDSAYFIAGATGSGITYQWYRNTGSGWNILSGQTDDTLKVTGINSSVNGYQYRCEIGSFSGTATTNAATLTVGVPTVITTQPTSVSTCEGDNVSFSVAATGTSLTYQWEENTGSGFGPISGATSSTLVRSFVLASMSGTQYRCVITGVCGTVTSNAVTLNVNSFITISQQPTPTSITTCAGSNVQFTMAATGVLSYQWQINTGSGYVNISGANDDTLTLTNVPSNYNNGLVRCVLVGGCNISTTNTATLIVETPGVWTGNSNSSWTVNANWSCGFIPPTGGSNNVVIPATALNMPIISTGVTINNLTIESGATLFINTSSGSLTLTGNLMNNGTINNTGGGIILAGTTAQNLNAGTYSGRITINNTNGVALTGNVTLNDTLVLNNGRVTLGNHNLTIGNTGAITGANDTRYIVATGSGSLTINNIGAGGRTGAIIFPIGSVMNYNPLTLTNIGTSDNYSARLLTAAYRDYVGNTPVLASAITNNVVGTTWIIDEAIPGGSNATVELQWLIGQELSGFNRSACYVSRYNGIWNPGATGAAGGPLVGPYTRSISGVTAFSPFGVASGGALPVELVSFTAKAAGKAALLNWVTASETNNSHFIIERSADNVNFNEVQTVKGQLNSTQLHSYELLDNDAKAASANNTVYYRLTQVDMDGSKHLSGVASVTFSEGAVTTLVAPNPFTSNFTVTLSDAGTHTITIKDITGKVLVSKQVNNSASIEIDELAGVSAGMYFLSVDNGTAIKIVKQ